MLRYLYGSLIVSVNEGADADRIAELLLGNKFLGEWNPVAPSSPTQSCQPTGDGVRITIDAKSSAPVPNPNDTKKIGEFVRDIMGIDGVSDVQGNLTVCGVKRNTFAEHCLIDGNRVTCECE